MQVAMFMYWRGEPDARRRAECIKETGTFARELSKNGTLVGGNLLKSSDEGFRFDKVDDEPGRFTDGPFAEATEVLAGLFVLEVESLDQARELATRNPHARFGSIEVRAIAPRDRPRHRQPMKHFIIAILLVGGCAKKQPAPEPPPPSEDPGVVDDGTRPPIGMSAFECTAKGGTVVGDIGDGAIHRPDYLCPDSGKPPLGPIEPQPGEPVAVEGAVCCV